MLSPYLTKGLVGDQEMNQSMVGVLTRLSTTPRGMEGPYARKLMGLNLVDWSPRVVSGLVKTLSLVLVGLLAVFSRTKTDRRTDPRLLGEFSLVVLTMLFVSERSWKHHYVTLLLRYTYLMYEFGIAPRGDEARSPGHRGGDIYLGPLDGDDLECAGVPVRPARGTQGRSRLRHVPLGRGGPLSGNSLESLEGERPCRWRWCLDYWSLAERHIIRGAIRKPASRKTMPGFKSGSLAHQEGVRHLSELEPVREDLDELAALLARSER